MPDTRYQIFETKSLITCRFSSLKDLLYKLLDTSRFPPFIRSHPSIIPVSSQSIGWDDTGICRESQWEVEGSSSGSE